MKKGIAVLAIMLSLTATSQVKLAEKQLLAFSVYADPFSSIKEDGLDFSVDIEYLGDMYAKFGIRSFSAIEGGYKDTHVAFGMRFAYGQEERISSYIATRIGFVSRNGGLNPNAGFEIGIDYIFETGFITGINASYIYKGDMKAIGMPEIWEESISVKIGYSWDW